MFILKINDLCNKVEFYLLVPSIILLLGLACFWDLYFWKKIKIFTKKYSKAIQDSLSDPFDNYIRLALRYKREQVKYRFLFVINMVEGTGAFGYAVGTTLVYFLWVNNNGVEFPSRFAIENCSIGIDGKSGMPDFVINALTEVSVGRILITIGQLGILWSMALGVCLIQYLNDREYNKENKGINTEFLNRTGLISVFILITGCIKELRLVEIVLEPIIQIIYFIIWVKHIHLFYRVLRTRVSEYKAQQRRKSVIRLAISNMHQFGVIMCLNVIAYACFILAELIISIFFIVYVGVYYGPCLFSYLYGLPAYVPLLREPEQVKSLVLANATVSIITKILTIFAQTIITTHYSVVSGVLVGNNCWPDIKTRFGFGVRVRFTPSLVNPLIFTHQEEA